MNHIKVIINKPDPPDLIIRKYKNFNLFIDRYKQYHTTSGIRNLFKNDIKKLVFIVIIVLLLLILLFSEGEAYSLDIIPYLKSN